MATATPIERPWPHRVRLPTENGHVDVEAASFMAAIGIVLDALAADVRPVAVFRDPGGQYETEVIERAVQARLRPQK